MLSFLLNNYPAALMVLTGLILKFVVGNRRFNRRSSAGMQGFTGFLIGVVITLLEWLAGKVAWALIIVGLLSLLIAIK